MLEKTFIKQHSLIGLLVYAKFYIWNPDSHSTLDHFQSCCKFSHYQNLREHLTMWPWMCSNSPQAVSQAAHAVPEAALRSSLGETAGGFPWAQTLSRMWWCRHPGTARQGPGCCAHLWSAKRQVLADLLAHPTGKMVLFNFILHNSKMHYKKQQKTICWLNFLLF